MPAVFAVGRADHLIRVRALREETKTEGTKKQEVPESTESIRDVPL
jgi:hypothetical protein